MVEVPAFQPLTAEVARESDEMFRRRWRALLSVDKLVGNVIDKLQQLGVLNNTYILYSSDHGTLARKACPAPQKATPPRVMTPTPPSAFPHSHLSASASPSA